MLKKILRGLFTIIGLILGYLIGDMLLNTGYFVQLDYFKSGTDSGNIIFIFIYFNFWNYFIFNIPYNCIFYNEIMDYVEKSIQKVTNC